MQYGGACVDNVIWGACVNNCKGMSDGKDWGEFKWNKIMYLITIHMYLYSELQG